MSSSHAIESRHVLQATQPGHAFIPIPRGPVDPPALEWRIDYRPESRRPWWAISATGVVIATCETAAGAQFALTSKKEGKAM